MTNPSRNLACSWITTHYLLVSRGALPIIYLFRLYLPVVPLTRESELSSNSVTVWRAVAMLLAYMVHCPILVWSWLGQPILIPFYFIPPTAVSAHYLLLLGKTSIVPWVNLVCQRLSLCASSAILYFNLWLARMVTYCHTTML